MIMEITRLDLPRCSVGEGPVWDVAEQAFYWIDILGKKVFRKDFATGELKQWDVPEIIGSMALREGGGAIVALASGVHTLDFETGACEMLATSPEINETIQLADGKVDRKGRFIVGSSDRSRETALGRLYVLDPGATELRTIDEGVILGNGPCFSADDKTLYHADSARQLIYAYDYDLETGTASNRRDFASTEELGGIPDGATVDTENYLWSAICEGQRIVRFRPDGSIERTIDFPVKLPGSVMFGGPALDRLFVPSIDPSFLGREPAENDGMTFVIDNLGFTGIAEPRFAG